jgi:mycothiol synthase
MTTILPQGYRGRPARIDEIESIVEVFNADTERLLGVRLMTVEDLVSELDVPGFDIETDAVVVISPQGQVVAYQDAWNAEEPFVVANCYGRVHPDHTRRGIGAYLLDWAERRSRQGIARAPEGVRCVMRLSTLSLDQGAQRLFERAGLQLVRHYLRMVSELNGTRPVPQWPAGITVRTIRAGQDERAVYQAVQEAFQDHWGFVESPLNEGFQIWKRLTIDREDFDPSLWFLAMDGEQIAGFSLCRLQANDDPQMGWVRTLGVLRPWRRCGLGLALLLHSFAEFSRRGQARAGLGVDAQNLTGATRLYSRAGMQPDQSQQFSIYEKELRPGIDLSRQSADEE